MPRPTRLLAAAAAAVLSLAAAACSSGGGAKPTNTAVPLPTGTPLPAAFATAVAQGGSVPLAPAPYSDPSKRFTAKLPQGWTVEPIADGVTASVLSPGGKLAATLSILCRPGITEAELVQEDQRAGSRLGSGAPDLANAKPGKVAGVPAQTVAWSGKLGSLLIEHLTVYFAGKGCAWRIQLNTFPGSTITQFRPVLDGVIASFAFS
ncbi:MAG: hypothetical protein KGK07_13155 [Chloroflexota bacterium]|nr:hypothetical protein [Chloroflexota bacterium]